MESQNVNSASMEILPHPRLQLKDFVFHRAPQSHALECELNVSAIPSNSLTIA
jgi:hypothetical protein